MEYIVHHLESDFLRKYSSSFVDEFLSILNNQQSNFIPFNNSPKHYTLSIYEPLNLTYVVLGKQNYVINLNYLEDNQLTELIDSYCKFNNIDETTFRRKIEYLFLNSCQKKISRIVGEKFQLYLTQHITEVSFNITDMSPILCDDLMEQLEE